MNENFIHENILRKRNDWIQNNRMRRPTSDTLDSVYI